MAFSMGIQVDSPGYGGVLGRPRREKHVKERGDWTPEETNWTTLWLKEEPYVESTFCNRCFLLITQLLQGYEKRGEPG